MNKGKVAFFGDSITVGGGTSDAKFYGFAYLAAARLSRMGVHSDVWGYGGCGAGQLCEKAPEIAAKSYGTVVLEAGTNDWNYACDIGVFEEDYSRLLDIFSDSGAKICCMSLGWFSDWAGPIPNPVRESGYNEVIRKLCAERGIAYIDVYSAMKDSALSFEELTYPPDRVHPNDAGAKLFAETVLGVITK